MELFGALNRIYSVSPTPAGLPSDYPRFLRELKARIQAARVKAVLSVNREMIALYWDLGRRVVERQKRGGWGTSVIERLSRDIRAAFPGIKGFSKQNIWYMRAFYRAWPDLGPILQEPPGELSAPIWQEPPAKLTAECQEPPGKLVGAFLQRSIAELPWWHNVILIEKLKSPEDRLWYARQALQHGWSSNVLALHIGKESSLKTPAAPSSTSAGASSPPGPKTPRSPTR